MQRVRMAAEDGPAYGLIRRLYAKGVGRLGLLRGITPQELAAFCTQLGDGNVDT